MNTNDKNHPLLTQLAMQIRYYASYHNDSGDLAHPRASTIASQMLQKIHSLATQATQYVGKSNADLVNWLVENDGFLSKDNYDQVLQR